MNQGDNRLRRVVNGLSTVQTEGSEPRGSREKHMDACLGVGGKCENLCVIS